MLKRSTELLFENELESRGNILKPNGNFYNDDDWEKDYSSINDSNAIYVYRGHGGREAIKTIEKHSFDRAWVSAYVFGIGIYTNYSLRQTLQANYYGDYIFKCRIDGGLKDFLVFEKDIRDELGLPSFEEDIKVNFPGLTEFLTKRGIDVNRLSKSIDSKTNETENTSKYELIIQDACGGSGRVSEVLAQFGVAGVVYFNHDRETVVVYNVDRIKPVAYVKRKDAEEHLNDINNIPWVAMNNNLPKDLISDIKWFRAQFNDNFIINDNDRAVEGELLCKNKTTGLWTFIDIYKAKDRFKDKSIDARLFGEHEFEYASSFNNGFAEVKIPNIDDAFDINKKGDLFEPNNHSIVYGNIFKLDDLDDFSEDDEYNNIEGNESDVDNFFNMFQPSNDTKNVKKVNEDKIKKNNKNLIMNKSIKEIINEAIEEVIDECGLNCLQTNSDGNEAPVENNVVDESIDNIKNLMERMGCGEIKKSSNKSLMKEHFERSHYK